MALLEPLLQRCAHHGLVVAQADLLLALRVGTMHNRSLAPALETRFEKVGSDLCSERHPLQLQCAHRIHVLEERRKDLIF